ncbi:MAG: hypothetical protein IJ237_06520 [Oscillospiraceae bacterium]|nr:hypothetical protein [Oscillospiraceae bacterium]
MNEVDMMEKIRQARNKYQREWRAKHPDKVRAINMRYWQKKVMEELNGREEGTQQSCQ